MNQVAKAQRTDQRQARDRSRLLLEVNNAIVSHLELPELLKAISACLRQAISHDAAGLVLYDSETHQLRVATRRRKSGRSSLTASAWALGGTERRV